MIHSGVHKDIPGLFGEKHNAKHHSQLWLLESSIQYAAKTLQALCAVGSLAILFGYALSIESLYRPLPGGPATHPLTAQSIGLLAIGSMLYQSHKPRWLFSLLMYLALSFAVLRIAEVLFSLSLTKNLFPFQSIVTRELGEGKHNAMGLNTALTLCMASTANILSSKNKHYSAQFIAFSSLIFPTISLTGYCYGIEQFFGEMSLTTSVLCISICLSTFWLAPRKGVMRALLSRSVTGTIVRLQVLVGITIPLSLGYIFLHYLSDVTGQYYIASFVVSSSWFVSCLFFISAAFHERIEHAHQISESRLRHAATHDPLTNLPNRRKFFENAQQELLRSRRTGTDLWLLMIDVDHFKKVNDRAGHQTGDAVLKQVANILKNTVRATDTVCRFGGEEFAALLPDADNEGAIRVADGIRTAMENTQFDGYSERYGAITLSIGMEKAQYHEDLNKLLSRADNALYRAKKLRNNIVSATK